MARILAEGNVDVRTAADTEAALAVIGDFRPEILITDLVATRVDGFRLMEAAREASDLTRVVVAFNSYAPDDLVRAVELDVDAFVRLPADRIKLRDAVMRCARRIVSARRMAPMDSSRQQLLDFFPGPALLTENMAVNYMNRPLASFLGFASYAGMAERDVGLEDFIVKVNGEAYDGHPGRWIDAMVNDPLDRDHTLHVENPRRPGHSPSVFTVTFNPFPGSDLLLFSFQDVTALEEEKAVLHGEASTDPLTGALNRRSFNRRLDNMLVRGEPFGLIMFDIDHFKAINDGFGHDAGDAVLVELTRLVRENIRGKDTLARWGGEEFMVLVPGNDPGEIVQMAERLRRAVAGFAFGAVPRPVTASFGVALSEVGEDGDSLTKRADRALYQAKESGRDRVRAG